MDAGEVIKDILDYFYEGYYRDGFSFFRRSSEPLKERLREVYFNSYRNRNEPLRDEENFAKYIKFSKRSLKERNLAVKSCGKFRKLIYSNFSELRPRTGDFISAALSSIFLSLSEKASFDSSLKEEIIKKLIYNGYSHLFDNEEKTNSNNDKR